MNNYVIPNDSRSTYSTHDRDALLDVYAQIDATAMRKDAQRRAARVAAQSRAANNPYVRAIRMQRVTRTSAEGY